MSFHRSKLEMNRRLDFRTGEGCLRQEAVCFRSEAVVGRLRNQEQLTITGNSALLVASDRITLKRRLLYVHIVLEIPYHAN